MKRIIYTILFYSACCSSGYAQFDKSGYKFLCHYDNENTSVTTKFTDTNFYLLRNTGKIKEGLLLESHSLIDHTTRSIRYLFDKMYTQRTVSQIGIEQFAYQQGRLAVLSNQGIYFAKSPEDPLTLLSSDITAFEFDGLELNDSTLYVFRNSLKTFDQPFFEMVVLNIKTGESVQYALENEVNARVYSNFRDTRLIDCDQVILFRADYVLPYIYRYGPKKDTLSLLSDSFYSATVGNFLMPDSLIRSMETYATQSTLEFLDTTLKLNHSFYANRYLSVNNKGERITLFSSIPDPQRIYNPVFILSEWSVSDSSIRMEKFRKMGTVKNIEQPVNHALDVINLWKLIHFTEDESHYYFVIRDATALSPAGMTVKEYYEANYELQFEKTGYAVVRLLK